MSGTPSLLVSQLLLKRFWWTFRVSQAVALSTNQGFVDTLGYLGLGIVHQTGFRGHFGCPKLWKCAPIGGSWTFRVAEIEEVSTKPVFAKDNCLGLMRPSPLKTRNVMNFPLVTFHLLKTIKCVQ
ncbi:hypothetical protein A8F94_18460 [Bacillus sp. FJAT-27225]|nr:hypothetical protein A8F94_18460 [Bacillus sp. FJAT-27225]